MRLSPTRDACLQSSPLISLHLENCTFSFVLLITFNCVLEFFYTRRVSSSQKMVKNRPRFIYKTELAAIHKTSSTHSRQMFQALQRLNQKSSTVVQMNEKQTQMVLNQKIIHFDSEMIILEKVTPSSP
jgi:hypothetical protein